MDENKQKRENLDTAMCQEHSSGVSREIHSPVENTILAKSEKDDLHYVYSYVTRYVLLHTLSLHDISPKIPYIKKMKLNKFSGISFLINVLESSVFENYFKNILVAGEAMMVSDISFVEFLVSRCGKLCGDEPTYINFILVASFLSYIVRIHVLKLNCFRILYATEFCLDILYRRKFCKVFKSKEDYEKLRTFCNDFKKNSLTEANQYRNVQALKKWINLLKECIDTTEHSMWLNNLELELYEIDYSVEKNKEYKSVVSRAIENCIFSDQNRRETDKLLCNLCDTKCYNYLEYACMFL